MHITLPQMELLLNQILRNEEPLPYAFYINDEEITSDLETFLVEKVQFYLIIQKISTEAVLQIIYHPLSIYRVFPVTRCTDTLPGHSEAVIHVSFSPDGTLLGSGGGDAVVRFWDVETSTPTFECRAHK